MISQSFLRNYSIKKILTAAAVEKEKLKVYYAKNIRQVFKQNQRQLIKQQKHNRSHNQLQVFYRYPVNHMKSEIFHQRKNKNNTEFYRGKPKTPIRYRQIKLQFQKNKINEFKLIEDKPFTAQIEKNIDKSPVKRPQSIGSVGSNKRKRLNGFKKSSKNFQKNNFFEQFQNDLKENQIQLNTKMEQYSDSPKICLQNKQIIRCSSAGKKDNYILFRQEALKKSASRGQKFRKTIRQKYANLGMKKANWTELDFQQTQKN